MFLDKSKQTKETLIKKAGSTSAEHALDFGEPYYGISSGKSTEQARKTRAAKSRQGRGEDGWV